MVVMGSWTLRPVGTTGSEWTICPATQGNWSVLSTLVLNWPISTRAPVSTKLRILPLKLTPPLWWWDRTLSGNQRDPIATRSIYRTSRTNSFGGSLRPIRTRGYRSYDARGIEPMIPFGHGGSYTTFEWGEPTIKGTGTDLSVEVSITNTGEREGSEVVQVYVAPAQSVVPRPVKELAGFAKLDLAPGATGTARVNLTGPLLCPLGPSGTRLGG